MPVTTRAGEARHLDTEHQADPPQPDLGDEPLEAEAAFRRGAGSPLVLIDHGDPLARPSQQHGVVDQGILEAGGLLMTLDLLGGRLPDVDDGQPITVVRVDLVAGRDGQLAHEPPPSIPPLEDRRGSAGSAGRGGSSPCVAVRPADPTSSPEPAKASSSWRRSSHRTTASKAAWPTLG